ncbi:MAG: fumarate hydratase, partial [Puniceicoccales bacterium]|nr:fumarate hydratase [Puniceicoccales bacterium]
MATPSFVYQDTFPLGKDETQYRLITRDHVSVGEFEGKPILKVSPEGLTLLANQAFHDIAFMLRPAHLAQVAAILKDPEASENDKSVALAMLRNAEL